MFLGKVEDADTFPECLDLELIGLQDGIDDVECVDTDGFGAVTK